MIYSINNAKINNLTWADIDFENHRIKVTAKKDGRGVIRCEPKGRKNRIVPMSDESLRLRFVYIQKPQRVIPTCLFLLNVSNV